MEKETKKCPSCGRVFVAMNPTAKYHSKKCKVKPNKGSTNDDK